MTTWRNPLNGAPGTTVTAGNGGGDAWSTVVGGALTYVSAPTWSGRAAVVGASGTAGHLLRQVQNTGRVRSVGYVRIPTRLASNTDVVLVRAYTPYGASNVVGGGVLLQGAGSNSPRLALQTRGTGSYTVRWTSSAVPWDTWLRVEFDLDPGTSPTTGAARLRWYLGDSTTPQGDSTWITGINTAGHDGGYADVRHGTVAGVLIDHVGVRDGSDAVQDDPWPGFQVGVTEPTRDNTGAGTDGLDYPTEVVGDGATSVTVRSGEVYQNKIIRGWVNLHVGGTLRNCVVTGQDVAADGRPLVNVVVPAAWDGQQQAVVDHCTLQPTAASRTQGYSTAVGIKAFRITRTKILDCIDGLTVSGGATAPAVNVEGCYLGDFTALRPDPWGYWPATHNDGIQLHGCQAAHPTSSVTVTGTTIDVRPGGGSNVPISAIVDGSAEVGFSAVMVSKPTGTHSSILLDRNWLRGGNQTLNAVAKQVTAVIEAEGNRWERGTADGGSPPDGLPFVAAYVSVDYDLRWSEDNVWTTGGKATPIRQKHATSTGITEDLGTMWAKRCAQVTAEHRAMLSEIYERALVIVKDALAAPDAELGQALAVLKTVGPTLCSSHAEALAQPGRVQPAIQHERLFGSTLG